MKCPHCLHEIHPATRTTRLETYVNPKFQTGNWKEHNFQILAHLHVCSKCGGAIVDLEFSDFQGSRIDNVRAFPQFGEYRPAPSEVPAAIAKDYVEANEVLSISPKASAALARRCLQAVLSAHGYASRNLVSQVEAVLAETDARKSLPSPIKDNIDAIRNFGNFSAHPVTDQTTFQVVDVEQGEAEWCIEILLDLFDHYYVSPAKSAARRASLSAKLAAAGKPPMKR